MSALLLLVAVILFCLEAFNASIGEVNLVALGLAFLAASFLVGPVTRLVNRD